MINATLLESEGWDLNWPFSRAPDSLLSRQSYTASTVWTSRTNANFSVEPKSRFERHPNLWRRALEHLEVGRSSANLNPPQQMARFQRIAWTVEKFGRKSPTPNIQRATFGLITQRQSGLDLACCGPAFLANPQVKRDKGKLVTFNRGTSISTFHR